MRKIPVQRVRSIEKPPRRRKSDGGHRRAFVLLLLMLISAPAAVALPTPSPPVSSQQNTAPALLQSTLSMGAIDSSIPLWHSLSFTIAMPSEPKPRSIELHHFDRPCLSCHNPANVTEDRRSQDMDIYRMSIDVNSGCTSSCHPYNRVLNHPVGVNVPGGADLGLPLEDSSRINCLTCHLQTKSSSGASEESDKPVLTVPVGSDLCESCHARISISAGVDAHWLFSNKAHLDSANTQSTPVDMISYGNEEVDVESMTCVGCHDEKTITVPAFNESAGQKAARWRKMKDHPIGMDYSRIAAIDVGVFYYPVRNAESIRFFNGKVGCGSCHSLYSHEDNYLVQSNRRSALCKQCHYR